MRHQPESPDDERQRKCGQSAPASPPALGQCRESTIKRQPASKRINSSADIVNEADMISEHPEPTDATAKELYANAWRCAKPKCGRPPYSVDAETDKRTLNSRIRAADLRRGTRENRGAACPSLVGRCTCSCIWAGDPPGQRVVRIGCGALRVGLATSFQNCLALLECLRSTNAGWASSTTTSRPCP